MPRRALASLVAAATLTLAGCGIPVDPSGTLGRIDAGLVRVGASPSGTLVTVGGTRVSGELAQLVEDFADERGARVEWVVGSEEELVAGLEEGRLDLAIGGMTDATPWADRVAVTRSYPTIPGSEGDPVVILLPMGENGTQAALERFLDEEVAP
ncbi:hypothetical protein ACQ143_03700 [Microbacterium sp. MC2]